MRRVRAICGWMVPVVLATAAAWPAQAADDPIVTLRSEQELEIDLAMVLDDFLPPLLEMAAAEDEAWAGRLRTGLDLAGLTALERLRLHSTGGEQGFHSACALTLDMSEGGGLLGSLFSIPPGTMGFGRYLKQSDVVLLVSVQRLPERIAALNAFAARPELRELAPFVPPDPLGMTSMWGFDARTDILPALSGELDFVLFPYRDGQQSPVPNMAVALGLNDGPAFREKLLGILRGILGEERVAPVADAPGERAGAFTFYPLPEGWAYAVGPDFGLVTSDPARMKSLVSRPEGDLGTFEGSLYARLDADLLLEMVSAVAAREGAGSAEAGMIADALRRVGENKIGLVELRSTTGSGRLEVDLRIPRALVTAEYRALKEIVAAMPRMAAVEARKSALRGAVGTVDAALTRYGEEHGETFPATLDDLVAAGYLDAVPPTVRPTPLGRYLEGGYTYVPVRAADGTVGGYYFIVYGGGEGTGFDLFGADNITDAAGFHAAGDGHPDGVVSFAYGGTEIARVNELLGNR